MNQDETNVDQVDQNDSGLEDMIENNGNNIQAQLIVQENIDQVVKPKPTK